MMNSNSYVLMLKVNGKTSLTPKSLGRVVINKGLYVYVGSANIRRAYLRVQRHFIVKSRLWWHIDYLTSNEKVKVLLAIICYGLSEDSLYRVALKLLRPSIKGFGCSDYSGKHYTHLFRAESSFSIEKLLNTLLRICVDIELFIPSVIPTIPIEG